MFSIKPKKEHNNEYLNISNENNENNNMLSIDLKTINFENISVELALNILQLKHNEYYNMNQTEIIQYYNHKIKLTNNINNILALKIILKYKLKGLDIKINKINGIMVSEYNNLTKNSKKKETFEIEQKINSLINNTNDDFKIQQVQQNNFKIIQHNNMQNSNKNIIEFPKNLNNITPKLNANLKQNQNIIPNKNFNSIEINKQLNQISQQNLYNSNNNSKFISNEKHNNMNVINSSEFDIDTIINSYSQKKNQGL